MPSSVKPGFHMVVQVVQLLPKCCIYRCFHINLQRLILIILKLTNYYIKMVNRKRLLLLSALLFVIIATKRQRKRAKHRFWVRKIFLEREKLGFYQTLLSEMRITDREYFFRSVRTQIGSFGLATLAVDIVSYFTYASIRVGGAFPTVVHGPGIRGIMHSL